MKITVQCTSKNERLETDVNGQGHAAVADITLSPVVDNGNNNQYAMGAAIGTPNAPVPQNLQQQAPVQYNLNGALSFTVRDEQEAGNFKVGKAYAITIDIVESTPNEAAPKAK